MCDVHCCRQRQHDHKRGHVNAETTELPDYGTDADPLPSQVDSAFAELAQLVLDEERAHAEVIRCEEALSLARQRYDHITTRSIPELLDTMHMKKCTMADGTAVEIEQKIRASLPSRDKKPAERAAGIQWLIDNGHGGCVKNHVGIDLDRGDDARADDLVVRLTTEGFSVNADKDVHAQTLSALVRELLSEGRHVPRDLISVFDQRVTKIKRRVG